ncbi:MAG: type II secretion system minor pseudopilin GspI [Mariprofundales bacterium]|nr:type II secretion system minor pseudopilin GspI [Mariprofundales bacterium]
MSPTPINQSGFTMLEVMVALAIAATALVTLMGREGASADIQEGVSLHALALATAVNQLEGQRLEPSLPNSDTHGEVTVNGQVLQWRGRVEHTATAGFVIQHMAVTASKEPPVKLFLYRLAR